MRMRNLGSEVEDWMSLWIFCLLPVHYWKDVSRASITDELVWPSRSSAPRRKLLPSSMSFALIAVEATVLATSPYLLEHLATTSKLLSPSGREPRICSPTRSTDGLCVRNAHPVAKLRTQNLMRCYFRFVDNSSLRRTRAVADVWLAWRACACAAVQKVCLDALRFMLCVWLTDSISVELCECIFWERKRDSYELTTTASCI